MTSTKLAVLAIVCIGSIPPVVHADEANKRTLFTFNAPVEIPGQVLTPGKYVFKLLNSTANRNIVQVFDKDERHLIGTFLTIPDYRMTAPSKPLITFEERPAGTPEAIKSWFYPGDNMGNEFVYPKARAVQLATQSNQNVPSMPTSLANNTKTATENQNSQQVNEMKQADLKAEKPSGAEVEIAEVFLVVAPIPPVAADSEAPARTLMALVYDEPAPAHSVAAELPETASVLPLLGLGGLLLLSAGLVFRARASRTRLR
jgi:hypothetical protein